MKSEVCMICIDTGLDILCFSMSGRCYCCATSFGFFKKELGCKNCGYAFCKDCLKKKIAVPKRQNEVHKVCNSCYDILSGKTDPAAKKNDWSPPEAYKKRVAALNNPKPAPGASKPSSNPKKYPSNMKKEDIAIAERLEKLKESRKAAVPSQQEIDQRMAKLKEPIKPIPTEEEMRARIDKLNSAPQNPSESEESPANVTSATTNTPSQGATSQPPVAPTTGKPMQLDDASKLMGRYNELANIDQKYAPQQDKATYEPSDFYKPGVYDEEAEVRRLLEMTAKEAQLETERSEDGARKEAELRARLDKLKGSLEGDSKKEQFMKEWENKEEDEESEDVAAEKVLKKILGSNKMKPDPTEDTSEASAAEQIIEELEDAPESDPEDQLPWCSICNNDATLRCYGCDGDLYCNRCYKEGHDREDYADHKTRKFKPATGSPNTSP